MHDTSTNLGILGSVTVERRPVSSRSLSCEERFGITSARAERAAQRRDATDALADQPEAGCVHVVLPHVVLTVEGLEVSPLQAVSEKQLAYARAVRASAVHGFLSVMLARGAKLPRSNVEEQMPMLAGWAQSRLRAETESRYWLDGQARAEPGSGVLGEAFREARAAKVEMPGDPLLHIDLVWPCA